MPTRKRFDMFAPTLLEDSTEAPRDELARRLMEAKANTGRVEQKVRGQRGMYPEPEASAYPETWGEIGVDVAKGAGQGVRNSAEGTLGMVGDLQEFLLGLGGLEDYKYMPTSTDIAEYTGKGLQAYEPKTPFGQASQFAGEFVDPVDVATGGAAKKGAGLLTRLLRRGR